MVLSWLCVLPGMQFLVHGCVMFAVIMMLAAVISVCSAVPDAVALSEFIVVVEVNLEEGLASLKLKPCSLLSRKRVKIFLRLSGALCSPCQQQ